MEAHISSAKDTLDQEIDRSVRLTAKLAGLAERFAVSMDDARARERELGLRLAASADDAKARETALQAKLEVRAEMAVLRARPWWRR